MKETKIEKLILDLSTRWEVSPEEAVDRLNSMNESEINKLINSMTKKFKNGGFIDCLRNGGSISKCKCGCDKIAKAEDGKKMLPKYAKIVEQGWDKPRYTFLSDINGGDLSTVTPDNLHTYKNINYAVEEVANPWGAWVNQLNRNAGLPEMQREYRKPMFRMTAEQDDLGNPIIIDYSMEFLNKNFDNKKASKELEEKRNTIRKGQNGLYDLGGTPRWRQVADLINPYRSRSFNTPFVGMGSNFDVNTQFVRPLGARFLNKYWTPKITSDNPMSGTSLAKVLGNEWGKDYNLGSNKVGPVTNPVDVLKAGPRELMSDEEMNSRRANAKKIDIDAQIANAKNFSQAFGLARKAGLKEFDWKGKRIAVKLKSDSPESTTQTISSKPTIQNTATKPTTQNAVNNSKPQETTVVEPWRDALASGGAGLYPFAAPVPGVGTDAYLGPTGQMDRPQTGYVAPTNSIESQVAVTGVNPNSTQGRRMARLAKYSNIK